MSLFTEDGYLGTITFANMGPARETSPTDLPPAKKSKLGGAVANRKDVADTPTTMVSVGDLGTRAPGFNQTCASIFKEMCTY